MTKKQLRLRVTKLEKEIALIRELMRLRQKQAGEQLPSDSETKARWQGALPRVEL